MNTEGRSGTDERAAKGFGSANRQKVLAMYGLLLAGAAAALFVLLSMGRHLRAPKVGKGPDAGSATESHILWRLLLAAVIIMMVARAVGALFRRINQPQVVGEIAAGVILGPSVLGALWPG